MAPAGGTLRVADMADGIGAAAGSSAAIWGAGRRPTGCGWGRPTKATEPHGSPARSAAPAWRRRQEVLSGETTAFPGYDERVEHQQHHRTEDDR